MFRLPPIPFWRRLGLAALVLHLAACVLGTWASGGKPIAIQFTSDGAPSAWASPWTLWGLLLMAVFSLFTASARRRPGPGQFAVSVKTSCALACGLSWLISLASLTLAVYALWPVPAVFYGGLAAALAVLPLFLMLATLRRRWGGHRA